MRWASSGARMLLSAVCAACLVVWVSACDPAGETAVPPEPEAAAVEPAARATAVPVAYVGAEACASCHPEETARWRGSHHDRAMETPDAVLAPFSGETFEHAIGTAQFRREGETLVVTTEGEDAAEADFEVAYTFGISPLQQVLLPLPGGRLQAFRVAWDSRPEAEGGGRWFALQPEEPGPPGDVMHWTGVGHSWNTQCADCHSTAVRRGFDSETGDFDTTYQEIDVACEACHGPSSRHAAAARDGRAAEVPPPKSLRDERRWEFGAGDSIAHRVPARASDEALEVCAPCHSRRSPLTATTNATRSFLDGYRPALLDEGLYHADGQILDEVYVWGSFVQSRMHGAGVRCGDCHDPHAPSISGSPDAVCQTCHRSESFDTPAHHHHSEGGTGASCVGCHMPARTYMEIDERRDHSFRVPRPDLSVEIGTPSACTDCHADRDATWAREAALRFWPALGERSQFARAIHAGRSRAADAPARLRALLDDSDQPAIARATALRLLGAMPTRELPDSIAAGARSADPLVRLAAIDAARSLPPQLRVGILTPLLDDVRAVRIDAARELVIAADSLSEAQQQRVEHVLNEWVAARRANADQPSSDVALGNLYRLQGRVPEAREAFERALRLAPWFTPASVNLADLLREQGQDEAGIRTLQDALDRNSGSADLHHALGLAFVRSGDLASGLGSLERAAELAPGVARYSWVLAVAYRDGGRSEDGMRVLLDASRRDPADRTLLATLAEWAMTDGNADVAREAGTALLARDPADPLGTAVLQAIPAP